MPNLCLHKKKGHVEFAMAKWEFNYHTSNISNLLRKIINEQSLNNAIADSKINLLSCNLLRRPGVIWSNSEMLTKKITTPAFWKEWIHFRRSDFRPPISIKLKVFVPNDDSKVLKLCLAKLVDVATRNEIADYETKTIISKLIMKSVPVDKWSLVTLTTISWVPWVGS